MSKRRVAPLVKLGLLFGSNRPWFALAVVLVGAAYAPSSLIAAVLVVVSAFCGAWVVAEMGNGWRRVKLLTRGVLGQGLIVDYKKVSGSNSGRSREQTVPVYEYTDHHEQVHRADGWYGMQWDTDDPPETVLFDPQQPSFHTFLRNLPLDIRMSGDEVEGSFSAVLATFWGPLATGVAMVATIWALMIDRI
ncbi:MAG: hypothetical protein HN348_08395 [Proteobacteria bacterium]|jgi:hypothetical protein|nr:hypothetical protein [Pseudomonadota bacterium]